MYLAVSLRLRIKSCGPREFTSQHADIYHFRKKTGLYPDLSKAPRTISQASSSSSAVGSKAGKSASHLGPSSSSSSRNTSSASPVQTKFSVDASGLIDLTQNDSSDDEEEEEEEELAKPIKQPIKKAKVESGWARQCALCDEGCAFNSRKLAVKERSLVCQVRILHCLLHIIFTVHYYLPVISYIYNTGVRPVGTCEVPRPHFCH